MTRRASGWLAACALAGAVLGCRSVELDPAELSDGAVVLDLPVVRQDELHACGLASVAALCRYWGVEIPAAEREDLARRAEEQRGLSGSELCAALERAGLETFLFQGSLDRSLTGLYTHVDEGRPLIVMLSPFADEAPPEGPANHYCLVLGYDEPRGNLVLLDPAQGEVLSPLDTFERDWAACRRFTLLACRPGSALPRVADSPSSSATTP